MALSTKPTTATVFGTNSTDDYLMGNSSLTTSAGAVYIQNDVISGSVETILYGADGVDTMEGGLGDDIYVVNNIADIVIEALNEGNDTIYSTVNYAASTNVENIAAVGAVGLKLTGNALGNQLDGLQGTGVDTLIGGAGDDIYYAESDDIVVETTTYTGTINDKSNANGNDTIVTATTVSLASGAVSGPVASTSAAFIENVVLSGADTDGFDITGNALANRLTGDAGENDITGGAGNDILDGGVDAKNDNLIGGAGDDTYIIRTSTDNVDEAASTSTVNNGKDTVKSFVNYNMAGSGAGGFAAPQEAVGVENLTMMGNGNTTGVANALANLIKGSTGDNGGGSLTTAMGGNIITPVTPAGAIPTSITGLTTTGTLPTSQITGLFGLSGNDTIYGYQGNDIAVGGDGGDTLDGGEGADTLDGGSGADNLLGDSVEATVLAARIAVGLAALPAPANPAALTDAEKKSIAEVKFDQSFAGFGNDLILGGTGADTLDGGSGQDTLRGGADNDVIRGGMDKATTVTTVTVNGVVTSTTTGLYGDTETFKDFLFGDTGSDSLYGGAGGDTLDGGADADKLYGDYVSTDAASVSGNGGADLIMGGAGTDTLDGGVGNDTMDGGKDADSLVGGAGDDSMSGGTGSANDTLVGGAGDNTMTGLDGHDSITGGSGSDDVTGGTGKDTVTLGGGVAADVINFATSGTNGSIDSSLLIMDWYKDVSTSDTIKLTRDTGVSGAQEAFAVTAKSATTPNATALTESALEKALHSVQDNGDENGVAGFNVGTAGTDVTASLVTVANTKLYLAVDLDKDGTFTADNDFIIEITGSTGIAGLGTPSAGAITFV